MVAYHPRNGASAERAWARCARRAALSTRLFACAVLVTTASCMLVATLDEPWHAHCDAGSLLCNGACVPEDVGNCGRCGNACGTGETCSKGACVVSCPAGLGECAGACVDLLTDPHNCGACNHACAAGDVCSAGACSLTCPATAPTNCSGTCSNTQTDASNCGRCGGTCGGAEVCLAGVCTMVTCMDGGAVCTPGQTMQVACGSCGQATQTCTASCEWGPAGACGEEGACAAGTMQQVPCGNCGQATQFCTDQCQWGTAGACTGEGVCAPGTAQCCNFPNGAPATCTVESCNASPSDCDSCVANGAYWDWYFCTSACQWQDCNSCSGCGCGT